MSFKPLTGITVVDLSNRLPGPLCGKILLDLGATVIKIEDKTVQDPFLSDSFAQFDSSFLSWYQNLNSGKDIHRFDFDSFEDQKKIRDLVLSSDAVIMGLPKKTREKLKITDFDLTLKKPMVVIELLASAHDNKSMHDLNALAMSGLLSLFVADKKEKILHPPFLPIAGISFGQKAATDLLGAFILAMKKNQTQFVKTYLEQATKEVLAIFWTDKDRLQGRTKFLHNGAYPCYSLYQTQDHKYVALAAVEEKFWNRFCEVFKIPGHHDRFFNKDQSLFILISNEIQRFTASEIELMIKGEDFCLSIIR